MQRLPKDILAFLISLLEFILMARFLLKLLGANPHSEAVAWLYQVSEPLLKPFTLAFPTAAAQPGGVLEYNTLFALFVYAFIGYAAEAVLSILFNLFIPPTVITTAEPDTEFEPGETVVKTKTTRVRRS